MSDVTSPVNPSKASDRTKAHRLRAKVKAQAEVTPEEAAWLADYEAAQATSKGASASRRVSYTEEEHASMGTGSAAETAAAAAMVREEGRRIDYLATTGINALVQACGMYKEMCGALLERTQQIEDVHMSMLGAVREHYIERTKAEAAAIRMEAEKEDDDPAKALLAVLMARMMPQGALPAPTATAGHRKPTGSKRR